MTTDASEDCKPIDLLSPLPLVSEEHHDVSLLSSVPDAKIANSVHSAVPFTFSTLFSVSSSSSSSSSLADSHADEILSRLPIARANKPKEEVESIEPAGLPSPSLLTLSPPPPSATRMPKAAPKLEREDSTAAARVLALIDQDMETGQLPVTQSTKNQDAKEKVAVKPEGVSEEELKQWKDADEGILIARNEYKKGLKRAIEEEETDDDTESEEEEKTEKKKKKSKKKAKRVHIEEEEKDEKKEPTKDEKKEEKEKKLTEKEEKTLPKITPSYEIEASKLKIDIESKGLTEESKSLLRQQLSILTYPYDVPKADLALFLPMSKEEQKVLEEAESTAPPTSRAKIICGAVFVNYLLKILTKTDVSPVLQKDILSCLCESANPRMLVTTRFIDKFSSKVVQKNKEDVIVNGPAWMYQIDNWLSFASWIRRWANEIAPECATATKATYPHVLGQLMSAVYLSTFFKLCMDIHTKSNTMKGTPLRSQCLCRNDSLYSITWYAFFNSYQLTTLPTPMFNYYAIRPFARQAFKLLDLHAKDWKTFDDAEMPSVNTFLFTKSGVIENQSLESLLTKMRDALDDL